MSAGQQGEGELTVRFEIVEGKAHAVGFDYVGPKLTSSETAFMLMPQEIIDESFTMDDLETLADALGVNTVAGDTGDAIRVKPKFAESADAPAARTEPMRDIVMLMPASVALEFGQQVAQLKSAYGTRTIVETVRRAVAEEIARLRNTDDAPGK